MLCIQHCILQLEIQLGQLIDVLTGAQTDNSASLCNFGLLAVPYSFVSARNGDWRDKRLANGAAFQIHSP